MPDDRNANLSSQDQSGPATVYFDGSCPLCTFEINHYEKHTRPEDVSYVDISSENKDLGPGLTQHVAMKRFHVRLPDGSLLSGARAFAALWEKTPNWKYASAAGGVVPAVPFGPTGTLGLCPALRRAPGNTQAVIHFRYMPDTPQSD